MKPTLVTLVSTMAVVSAWAVGQALTPAEIEKRTKTIKNAKMLGTAIIIYTADYDDVHPWAKSTKQVKPLVFPYAKDASVWQSLNPGSQFLWNANLSGVSATALPDPVRTPIAYESKAWRDGRRIVIYADGHVRAETAEKWPEIQKMLKKRWLHLRPGVRK